MAPFSISSALAAIEDDDYRRSTQSVIETLNETMRRMGYCYGVRDDSRLAFNWAYGTVYCDYVNVIEELCFMQWFSDTTSYQCTVEKALRKIANAVKDMYPDLSWADVWSIVKIYGPDIVRYVVLDAVHPTGVPALTGIVIENGRVVQKSGV
jgi:hypothetical protein